jgi:hypothetical protein
VSGTEVRIRVGRRSRNCLLIGSADVILTNLVELSTSRSSQPWMMCLGTQAIGSTGFGRSPCPWTTSRSSGYCRAAVVRGDVGVRQSKRDDCEVSQKPKRRSNPPHMLSYSCRKDNEWLGRRPNNKLAAEMKGLQVAHEIEGWRSRSVHSSKRWSEKRGTGRERSSRRSLFD